MMLYKMASKPNPISPKMPNLFSFASIIVILDPQLQVSQVVLTLVSRAFAQVKVCNTERSKCWRCQATEDEEFFDL